MTCPVLEPSFRGKHLLFIFFGLFVMRIFEFAKYMLKVEVMEDEATSREQNIRVEKDEDP